MAPTLFVRLFGRFELSAGTEQVPLHDGSRAQELLAYLLLHRGSPQPREVVACALWADCSTRHSRAYLRKAMWQLHTAFAPARADGGPELLRVDGAWIGIEPDADVSSDVALFERAYAAAHGVPGAALGAPAAAALAEAVALHRGGLLEHNYRDWCLVERERLRHLKLVMLEKLMAYGEARGDYEAGLLHGLELLRHDPAREHTHRQMMRLHHLRGDRTGALRQFHTCVATLEAELGVRPAEETARLYEEIRGGTDPGTHPGTRPGPHGADSAAASVHELLVCIDQLGSGLSAIRLRAESIAATLQDAPRLHAPDPSLGPRP